MINFLKNILPFNNREDMPVVIYVIKKILAFIFCFFASAVVGEIIVIGALMAMGKDPLHGDMFSDDIMALIMYYGYIIVVAIIILYWKLIEKKTLAELGFTKKFGSYFAGVLISIPLLLIPIFIIIALGGFSYNGVFENIDGLMILLYLGGFIFQGLYEEVLCRGLMLQTLKRKTPVWVAIAISTIAFIIPHASSFEGGIYSVLSVVNLVLISLIFSLLVLRFNNLWVACGLHSFWNFALFNILGLNLSGNDGNVTAIFNITSDADSIINGGAYGVEASAVTAVILGSFTVILLFLGAKKKEKEAVI